MKRKTLVTLVAIVIAFAAFLPLYYIFSYGLNDSLEQTIRDGNGPEGDEIYSAPLTYGDSYWESLAFGIVGLVVVFAVTYLFLIVVRRKRRKSDE